MASIKDAIKNSAKSTLNNAKNVAKEGLFRGLDKVDEEVFDRYTLSKNFINIRDFYKFIKSKSGANTPTSFWYFSVNFYVHQNGLSNTFDFSQKFSKIKGNDFFKGKDDLLAKLRMCVQSISCPTLAIRGAQDGVGNLSEGVRDISNLWGGYNILENSYVQADKHTFEMTVLNTQKPIVEEFLYPWMMAAVSSNYDTFAVPKVNIAIKFWGGNKTVREMEGVKPDFIYYFTGVFPINITAHSPKHMHNEGDMTRNVTFAFNDFIVLNSEADAVKYNLLELFGKNFLNNLVDKGREFLYDKGADLINKLFKDKKKNKNKGSFSSRSNIPQSLYNSSSNITNSKRSLDAPIDRDIAISKLDNVDFEDLLENENELEITAQALDNEKTNDHSVNQPININRDSIPAYESPLTSSQPLNVDRNTVSTYESSLTSNQPLNVDRNTVSTYKSPTSSYQKLNVSRNSIPAYQSPASSTPESAISSKPNVDRDSLINPNSSSSNERPINIIPINTNVPVNNNLPEKQDFEEKLTSYIRDLSPKTIDSNTAVKKNTSLAGLINEANDDLLDNDREIEIAIDDRNQETEPKNRENQIIPRTSIATSDESDKPDQKSLANMINEYSANQTPRQIDSNTAVKKNTSLAGLINEANDDLLDNDREIEIAIDDRNQETEPKKPEQKSLANMINEYSENQTPKRSRSKVSSSSNIDMLLNKSENIEFENSYENSHEFENTSKILKEGNAKIIRQHRNEYSEFELDENHRIKPKINEERTEQEVNTAKKKFITNNPNNAVNQDDIDSLFN